MSRYYPIARYMSTQGRRDRLSRFSLVYLVDVARAAQVSVPTAIKLLRKARIQFHYRFGCRVLHKADADRFKALHPSIGPTWSAARVGRKAGVDPRHIIAACRAGRLAHTITPGIRPSFRIREPDALAFLAQHDQRSNHAESDSIVASSEPATAAATAATTTSRKDQR